MKSNKKHKRKKINTLYVKLAVTLTAILLIMGMFLGLFIINTTNAYFVRMKETDMQKAADAISYLMVKYLKSEESLGPKQSKTSPDSDYYILRSRMATCHELLDVDIFISDRNGNIQMSFPLLPNEKDYILTDTVYFPDGYENHFIYSMDIGKYSFVDANQYSLCFKSDEYIVNTDDYYGFYTPKDGRHLTMCKRIVSRQEKNAEVYGAVVMSCSIDEIYETRMRLTTVFTVFGSAVVVLFLLLILIITHRIVKPLHRVTEGAKQIAEGNFKIRIKKETDDEIGELVDAFNQAAESLDNLDTVRNDFIANVSHELRTPMTSIRGFIEAMLDGVIPDEQMNEYLEKVRRETIRLTNLVNELLDWARLAAGQQEIEMKPINVQSIALTVISNMEPLINDKNIEIGVDFECSDGKAIGDESAIERVFINLIQNAVKFTPEGGKITVATKDIPELDKISITVSDTGIGMSEEEKKYIFERFYKADKSRSGDKNSTGLGLPIVAQILKNHNETIDVESEEGKGTSFMFTLPKNIIEDEED